MYHKPPPDQRPNWNRLNEGQRRYAWEQYNLALVRRGIPINHPIPEQEGARDADGDDEIDRILAEGNPPSEDAAREAIEDFNQGHFEGVSQGTHSEHNSQVHHGSIMSTQGSEAMEFTPTRSQGAGGAKRRLTLGSGSPSVSSAGSSSLPGTAQGQGEGGGSGIGDGSRPGTIIHPSRSIDPYQRFYRKVHRVLSFGFNYRPINDTANRIFMTTPLLKIPVEWLYWYMNPSEYNLLPAGARAIRCRCTVTQRNVRVAFPTNSTDNNLATLNQNKNVVWSKGLNKKIEGRDSRYTAYQTTPTPQPMIPTALVKLADADHTAIQTEMYGSAANIINTMPRHQFGQPMAYSMYYTPLYWTGGDEDGWQCMQNCVEEADADSTAGSAICHYDYEFSVGLIKPPKKAITRAFNSTTGAIAIPRSSMNLDAHRQDVVINATGQPQSSTAVLPTTVTVPFTSTHAYLTSTIQPIEKSQWLHEGIMSKPFAKCQESLHIGVQPTYALTSGALTTGTTNNSFTDTQAYFEVVMELEVDTNYSTFRPITAQSNTYVNNLWSRNDTVPDYYGPLIDGLLQNQTL